MTKRKTATWLFIMVGVLWILAGVRDLLAPGFFNMSGRTVRGSSIALNFVIGIVFLLIGSSQGARIRSLKNEN